MTEKHFLPFSVLMSVYKNDEAEWLREAVESVTIKQTARPAEVLLVIDGPIPDRLQAEIDRLKGELPELRIEPLAENRGLGLALQYGMERVSHELVARMDSDDISLPHRFEKQLSMFAADPTLSVVGTQIAEFIGEESNIVGMRTVPCAHEEMMRFFRTRDALNHMAVMFRRSEVMRVGNYQDWHFNEDSYLWLRMITGGCRFANTPDVGVHVRVGKEMYARRGGWRYFKSELGLQNLRLRHGIIALPRYCANVAIHFVVKVAMPNTLRAWVFKRLLRRR